MSKNWQSQHITETSLKLNLSYIIQVSHHTGCPNKNWPQQCFIIISITNGNFHAKMFITILSFLTMRWTDDLQMLFLECWHHFYLHLLGNRSSHQILQCSLLSGMIWVCHYQPCVQQLTPACQHACKSPPQCWSSISFLGMLQQWPLQFAPCFCSRNVWIRSLSSSETSPMSLTLNNLHLKFIKRKLTI